MNYSDENKFIELIGKIPNVAVQGYNKKREVIYWNNASEIIYGYTKKEALGKNLEDLIIPNFMKDEVISSLNNWCDNGVSIPSGEIPLLHKNGHIVYVYSSHVMLKENTSNPELFCIDIDLTAQKEQKKELDEKNKILEHQSKMENVEYKKSNDIVVYYDQIYKYRPFQGKWILKETSSTSNTIYLDNEKIKHVFDVKVNLEVKDFNSQPFPEFKKSVNEKMDIRRSFN